MLTLTRGVVRAAVQFDDQTLARKKHVKQAERPWVKEDALAFEVLPFHKAEVVKDLAEPDLGDGLPGEPFLPPLDGDGAQSVGGLSTTTLGLKWSPARLAARQCGNRDQKDEENDNCTHGENLVGRLQYNPAAFPNAGRAKIIL
jgi:hypothetical protein